MRHVWIVVSAAALAGIIMGCATSPAKRTENLLTQSGFKAVKATTAAQQQQLTKLPPDKLTQVHRKGRIYYVYPDPSRTTLYVGNQAQYQAYQTAVQDRYLSQDAKLVEEARTAPALNEDSAVMSGAEPGWEQIWEGWPE